MMFIETRVYPLNPMSKISLKETLFLKDIVCEFCIPRTTSASFLSA